MEGVQADGDRMGADGAPLTRRAAGTEIFQVDRVFDDQAGAISGRTLLDDALQDGRRPIRTEDFVRGQPSAGGLHGFPSGNFSEEGFS